jgi:hypothetical protein
MEKGAQVAARRQKELWADRGNVALENVHSPM